MTRSGLPVFSWSGFSKNGRGRYRRRLLAAPAALLALSVVPVAGAGQAQAAPLSHPAHSFTLASGAVKTKKGLDPKTSFCFQPTPAPASITNDPVNPTCAPLLNPAVSQPQVNPFVIKTPFPAWAIKPLPGSRWVGPQANGSDLNEGVPNWYVYDAKFSGCAVFEGQALADNAVGVFLNHHLLAHQDSLDSYGNFLFPLAFPAASVPFAQYSHYLKRGSNVVDFVVYDGSEPGTGLDYRITVVPLAWRYCRG
jgi:hypothetical protein